MNQESLVGAGHQPASITSLPFVHTARRYYRLNDLVRAPDGWVARRVRSLRRPAESCSNLIL